MTVVIESQSLPSLFLARRNNELFLPKEYENDNGPPVVAAATGTATTGNIDIKTWNIC